MSLETTYLHLPLKNPIIVAASPLTASVEKIKACEAAGAAAVVVRSLFEEQINSQSRQLLQEVNYSVHADAYDFLNQMSENYYLDEYLTLVEEAMHAVSIPVIPSLNCISAGQWLNYASRFEKIGCPAIELNLFSLPADTQREGAAFEKNYLDIAARIKKAVSIPVALKLGSYFSGMANILFQFGNRIGIDGLVLFNRFFRHDIDLERVALTSGKPFSTPVESQQALQWIALLSGELRADLVGATGLHSWEAVVKQLLVGAKAVQLASVLMQKGLSEISRMLTEIEGWMERHHYSRLSDCIGLLSQERSDTPQEYERVQYVKSLVHLQ